MISISCVEAECDDEKLKCPECKKRNFQNCHGKNNCHFHIVTGEGNEVSSRGVMFHKTIEIKEPEEEFEFKIGIISTKKDDMSHVSQIRGSKMVKKPKDYDLHRVKLRIDISVTNDRTPVCTIFSQTIYNKSNSEYKDLKIEEIFSDNRSPYEGGKKFMVNGRLACKSQIGLKMPGLHGT